MSDRIKIGIGAAIVVAVIGAGLWWRGVLASRKGQETFSKGYGLTLTDMTGKPVHLSDYRGKAVVAYAWASWCPYCADELTNLAKAQATFGDKLAILAINRGEPTATAKGYISGLSDIAGITFLLDPTDSFYKSIGGFAMPETVFIEPSGTVAYHQHGPITYDQVTAEVQKLLGAK